LHAADRHERRRPANKVVGSQVSNKIEYQVARVGDREMQRLRLPLLRFTASDVVRDDAGVAHEIALFVNEKCHEKTELRAAEAERDELLRENYLYRLGMPVC
jgi:hypothetical protein